ncbi:MAG: hypothetical protein LBJ23_08815 [Tannerella sp.]|nr:hypothetical protein [Tannerella sp.]
MKRFAAILFLTVIVFSVSIPFRERHVESVLQACASDVDCDGGGCPDCGSPFCACASCHGFEPVIQTMNFPVPTMLILISVPYMQPHFTAFRVNIWRPPRLA